MANGSVCNVDAFAQLPIGIKSLETNPMRSLKDRSGRRGIPVPFGNAAFTPAAAVVSDSDGVLVLPTGTVV